MSRNLETLLLNWPLPVITSNDIATVLTKSDQQRYSVVKRALKKKIFIQLKRGLYFIGLPYNKELPDPFTIAQLLYGPSYISFESALSYHGWIPEAVYSITSACFKRNKEYLTPIGRFIYQKVQVDHFYLGVQRLLTGNSAYFLADPWKALADLCYIQHKTWPDVSRLCEDLRIEPEEIELSDLRLLKELGQRYPSKPVRRMFQNFERELK
jgi:hypothetical protein